MSKLPVPPITDLARARGENRDELITWFRQFYESDGAPFNYMSGTRSIKSAYRGMHDIKHLVAGCGRERTVQGKKSNTEIVECAAPVAFDRVTQVFDLTKRQFPFGRDLYSSYRIPFFFVEHRIVKLYFLQPRKSEGLTYDQTCMIATIHKRFLLDTEFYGDASDVEYIDLSADPETKIRVLTRHSLSDLELWSEKRLSDRLTLISEALDYINHHGMVRPRKRRAAPAVPDMP